MSCISHNVLQFTHTPSVIDRFNSCQCKPDYFGCAPHKCFLVGGATKLHSDGEGQDAFDDSMIKSLEDNLGDADFVQLSQEIHTLLPLFNHCRCVISQLRSVEIVDPRNLNDSTCLTSVINHQY